MMAMEATTIAMAPAAPISQATRLTRKGLMQDAQATHMTLASLQETRTILAVPREIHTSVLQQLKAAVEALQALQVAAVVAAAVKIATTATKALQARLLSQATLAEHL